VRGERHARESAGEARTFGKLGVIPAKADDARTFSNLGVIPAKAGTQ
jgi:hypothetical protein